MNTKNWTKLVYLMLALAVLAAGVGWRPLPAAQGDTNNPDPAPAWADQQYTKGRVSARIVGDEVQIYGDRLPRNRDFFVKVRRSGKTSWERLGASFSDRNGVLDDAYRLPVKLRKYPAVQLCLKDVMTSKAYCVTARR